MALAWVWASEKGSARTGEAQTMGLVKVILEHRLFKSSVIFLKWAMTDFALRCEQSRMMARGCRC